MCGVHEYVSAQILAFLDLAEKSLVSAPRIALSPPEFPDGNGLKPGVIDYEEWRAERDSNPQPSGP